MKFSMCTPSLQELFDSTKRTLLPRCSMDGEIWGATTNKINTFISCIEYRYSCTVEQIDTNELASMLSIIFKLNCDDDVDT